MQNIDVATMMYAMPFAWNENSSPALNIAENTHAQCRPRPATKAGDIFPTPATSSSRYSIVMCGSLKNPPPKLARRPLRRRAPTPKHAQSLAQQQAQPSYKGWFIPSYVAF